MSVIFSEMIILKEAMILFKALMFSYVLFSLYWFQFHAYVILLQNPLPLHLKFFIRVKKLEGRERVINRLQILFLMLSEFKQIN